MQKLHRIYATIIIVILALSIMAPFSLVYASTGHPKLGAVDNCESPSAIEVAEFNISVPAGSKEVYAVDGVVLSTSGYFAIVFYVEPDWLVDFSGAQFDLYMSQNGYSHISSGDKKYAQGFSVADLDASPLKTVHVVNSNLKGGEADFYIGTFTDAGGVKYKVLVGPIMFDDVTPLYKYIKIYDGDVTSVAVGTQTVDVLPALELTPTYGPGGASVTLKGAALEPNELLNLTYFNDPNTDVFAQVWTDSVGKFTYSWNIKDLKEEFENPVETTEQPILHSTVDIYAWYNATGDPIATVAYGLNHVTYDEYARAFWQFKSVKAGAEIGPGTDEFHGWGNATDAGEYIVVDVYVFDTLIVAGVWWNPTGPVNFVTDSISWGSVTPNATGFFNISLTVPELYIGEHIVKVYNAGVRYEFKVNVLPTLMLTPEEGTIGTVVQVKVYGFPYNALIGVWWYEKALGDGTWYNLVNGTTGPDGKFNVTVTFIVPHAYGGEHTVAGDDTWPWDSSPLAEATFTVLPKLEVAPSVIKNDGSPFFALGTGFDPTKTYTVNVDNQAFLPGDLTITCDDYGDLNITLIAAGFRPGLHVVALYESGVAGAPPAFSAVFNVTVEGDPIIEFLKSMNATLVEIRDGVATINSTVGEIKVDLSAINATITDLIVNSKGEILVAINTALGNVTAKLDDLNATLVSLASDAQNNIIAEIWTAAGNVTAHIDSLGLVDLLNALELKLDNMNATLVSVKDGVAEISLDIGDIKVKLNAINATITGLITDAKGEVLLTIDTAVGTVTAKLDAINASIAGLITTAKGEVLAKIDTALGTVTTKLDAINATIIAIKDDVALIKTAVGTIESGVDEIKELVGSAESAIIAKIENETATIQLKIGGSTTEIKASVSALEPKIKEVKDGVATVDTKIGTLQADVSTIKDYTKTIPDAISGLVAPIWAAVILSLIAAIAAIYAVITIRRKIAG
jgi:hypothetical protein